MKKRLTIFLFVSTYLLLNVQTSHANYPNISPAVISRKIDQPTITQVHRDQDGFLWVGTQQGLYRFNGDDLTFYGPRNKGRTIPASDISGIQQDSKENIWVSTFGAGLLKLNTLSDQFEPIDHTISDLGLFISHLLISKSDYIFLGSKEGVFLYDSKLNRGVRWFNSNPISKKIGQPTGIAESGSKQIYILSENELYLASLENESLETIELDERHLQIGEAYSFVMPSPSGAIYVATNTGSLFKLGSESRKLESKNRIGSDAPSTISSMVIFENTLWISSNNGLWFSDLDLKTIREAKSLNAGLSNSHIVTMHCDETSVWVGTYQGLDLLTSRPFEILNEKNSNVFNDVLAFEQDQTERLWVGTYDGLFVFDPIEGIHKNYYELGHDARLNDQRIMAISSRKNEIWLGYRHGGVQIVNTESFSTRSPKLPMNETLAVTQILHINDRESWIATYNSGLFRIRDVDQDTQVVSQFMKNSSVNLAYLSKLSGLLIATGEKIYRFDEDTDDFHTMEFTFGNATHSPLVFSIRQGSNGDIWFGTKDNGLFFWSAAAQLAQEYQLVQVAPDTLVPSSTIYAIEFDSDSNLWCSTQNGVIKLSSKDHLVSHFTSSDGLQGNDFNFGASITDKEGDIYFGGVNGYNRFSPSQVKTYTSIPKIILTQADVSSRIIDLAHKAAQTKAIELSHNDYFITLEFSVLDFLDPEKNQYRYQLQGFDPDWVESGHRNTATYTNLPAGEYTFKVQGANSAGIWNREGVTLDITVLPAPWRTGWAYCLYSIMILAAFLAYRKYDRDKLTSKQAVETAAEFQRVADRAQDELLEQQELQDHLVQSLYQHNLSTLGIVGDLIESAPAHARTNGLDNGNGVRIEALAILESCVYHQDETLVVDLHQYTDLLLERLLQDAPIASESLITINDVSKQYIPAKQATLIAIVILELLQSAIQYAFDDDQPSCIIHIQLFEGPLSDSSERKYVLIVQDNGKGIPASVDPFRPSTPGFQLVHDLVNKLSANFKVSSESGTTVSLHIPVAAAEA